MRGLGIGLGLGLARKAGIMVPTPAQQYAISKGWGGATVLADFENGVYAKPMGLSAADIPTATLAQLTKLDFCTFADLFAFSAASNGSLRTYTDVNGAVQTDLAVDQPRFDWNFGFKGLRVNNALTNTVRNPGLTGGAVGTPGTLPTHVTIGNTTGLTRHVVAFGTAFGMSYTRYRLNGTLATAKNIDIAFEAGSVIAATVGQTWNVSNYFNISAGTAGFLPTIAVGIVELDSGGGFLQTDTFNAFQPLPTLQRLNEQHVIANASTAFIYPFMRLAFAAGAIDVTFDIYGPQLTNTDALQPLVPVGATACTTEICNGTALMTALMKLAGASALSYYCSAYPANTNLARSAWWIADAGNSARKLDASASGALPGALIGNGSANVALPSSGLPDPGVGVTRKVVVRFSGTAGDYAIAQNGDLTTGSGAAATPSGTTFSLGGQTGGVNQSDAVHRAFVAFPSGQSNANITAVSTGLQRVAAWGDSLTAGNNADVTYPASLAADLSRTVYNGGETNDTSTDILTRFLNGSAYYTYITIIWSGRNNYTDPTTVLANIASMVAALPPGSKYLVMDVLNANTPTEYSGTTNYNTIIALNASILAVYPNSYVAIREFIVGLFDPDLPTDVTANANDCPPPSKTIDGLHPNNLCNALIATFVKGIIVAKGW